MAADPALAPELLACSSVKRNSERLACYDRAVAGLQSGASETTPAAAPSAAFGLNADSAQANRSPATAEREEVGSLTARITVVRIDNQRMSIVELDNGQTWRQTTGSTNLPLKAGDEVTVSRAALGSFLMSVPTGPAVRVRRVR